MSKGDAFDEEGRKEVKFYPALKKEKLSLLFPNCHFAGLDDQTNQLIETFE